MISNSIPTLLVSSSSDSRISQKLTSRIGHWYLTKLLLPTMLETVKGSPPGSAVRVVHISSAGHYTAKAQPLDFASFKGGPARNKYSNQDLYIQSKFVSEWI
jgi:hypothetical protein